MLISLVVATYNRMDLLKGVLGTLRMQTLDPFQYEIIVVDNNSPDATKALVERYQAWMPNLRYCLETTQGASAARNRGWREARGEYVGFADDDTLLPPRWLELAREIILEQKPGGLGGPFYPFYISPEPHWFKPVYGSWTCGDQPGDLPDNQYLSGMNMFFRRDLLAAIGGFPTGLGPKGGAIGYGEEPAIQTAMRAQIPRPVIYYDPRLYVYHLVAPFRTTLKGAIRDRFIAGRYSTRVFWDPRRKPTSRLRLLGRLASLGKALSLDMLLGLPRRDRRAFPRAENFVYEVALPHCEALGSLYEKFLHTRVGRRRP